MRNLLLRLLSAPARLAAAHPVAVASCTFALLVLFVGAVAEARPGGGHSYSGGGRSSGGGSRSSGGGSSSGGGGGDGDALIFLIWLAFEHPVIGVPLLVIVGGFIVFNKLRRSGTKEWSTAPSQPQRAYRPPQQAVAPRGRTSPRAQLRNVRAFDPDFSVAVYEDFLFAFFTKLHEARGAGSYAELRGYLGPLVLQQLERERPPALRDVSGVVVGAMRLTQVSGLDAGEVTVVAEFDANLTESLADGRRQTYWVTERWTLSRPRSARSKAPDKARTFGCPNCGAPLGEQQGVTCSYCGATVAGGEFDWTLDSILPLRKEQRTPQLVSDVAEVGTNLPTIVDPAARGELARLSREDPAFQLGGLEARTRLIAAELYGAWTARDWTRVRPFCSDNLFVTQLYFVEAYKAEKLINVVDRLQIEGVELARVESDRFYDLVTVRVRASCLDYTVREGAPDRPLAGSKSQPRRFTEYWTLLRARGAKGAPRDDKACPNCGGALKINMSGACEYCGAKVTTGEFDWVLSRIEQDEEYAG